MRRKILPLFVLAALALSGAPARAQGEVERISLADFKALLASKAPVTILDVRGPSPTKIKGAVHIPLDQLESRADEIPRDRPVVTYCA